MSPRSLSAFLSFQILPCLLFPSVHNWSLHLSIRLFRCPSVSICLFSVSHLPLPAPSPYSCVLQSPLVPLYLPQSSPMSFLLSSIHRHLPQSLPVSPQSPKVFFSLLQSPCLCQSPQLSVPSYLLQSASVSPCPPYISICFLQSPSVCPYVHQTPSPFICVLQSLPVSLLSSLFQFSQSLLSPLVFYLSLSLNLSPSVSHGT